MARKVLGPLNLTKTQVFYIHEAAKIVVIGKHKNFMFAKMLDSAAMFWNFW